MLPSQATPKCIPTTVSKSSRTLTQQPLLHSTRANPFPKVTGLICRLPLPAFFILDRGCSPWGPDAVMGTLRYRSFPRTVFQGPPVANWTPENTRRSAKTAPVSPDKRIPQSTSGTVKQKRNLCPVRTDNVTATARVTASISVCRNINLLPFRR